METASCMMLVRSDASRLRQALFSALKSDCFHEIVVLLDIRTKREVRDLLNRCKLRNPGMMLKVYDYAWQEPADFAAARNYAISKMSGRYGFWLDSDEVIVDAEGLRLLLEHPSGCAFYMKVTSPLPDGHIFDMYQPRLFPMLQGVGFECGVFERIDWSLDRAGVRNVHTNLVAIYHTGYIAEGWNKAKLTRNIDAAEDWLTHNTSRGVQRYHLKEQHSRMMRRR